EAPGSCRIDVACTTARGAMSGTASMRSFASSAGVAPSVAGGIAIVPPSAKTSTRGRVLIVDCIPGTISVMAELVPTASSGQSAGSSETPVPAATFGGLRRQTAHQMVREQLRLAILRGTLAPGTPLVLSELSKQLDTSRTPIREAL